MSAIGLFIAIALPYSVKKTVKERQQIIRSQIPANVAWISPFWVHLTLKPLGEVPAEHLPTLYTTLSDFVKQQKPFELAINGISAVPNFNKPKAIWLGIDGDLVALNALKQNLEDALEAVGFPREERPLRPHITVGRIKNVAKAANVGQKLDTLTMGKIVSWQFGGLFLMNYQSTTPNYSLIQEFSLPTADQKE